MPKEANLGPEELNTSHTNAKETHTSNKSYLLINEVVKNSPFTVTKVEEKGWFLRAGDYRLTDYYEEKTEVYDMLITHQWQIVCQLIVITCENMLKEYLEKNS